MKPICSEFECAIYTQYQGICDKLYALSPALMRACIHAALEASPENLPAFWAEVQTKRARDLARALAGVSLRQLRKLDLIAQTSVFPLLYEGYRSLVTRPDRTPRILAHTRTLTASLIFSMEESMVDDPALWTWFASRSMRFQSMHEDSLLVIIALAKREHGLWPPNYIRHQQDYFLRFNQMYAANFPRASIPDGPDLVQIRSVHDMVQHGQEQKNCIQIFIRPAISGSVVAFKSTKMPGMTVLIRKGDGRLHLLAAKSYDNEDLAPDQSMILYAWCHCNDIDMGNWIPG